MPRFEITGPDGHKYQVEGPDGSTEQDALAQVQQQVSTAAQTKPAGPFGDKPLVAMSGQELPSSSGIGAALREGWLSAPTLVDPATNPVLGFVNLPMQAANALFRGGQQTVQEALSPISPQLGRDVAAIPEAFMGSPHPVAGEVTRIPTPAEVIPQVRNALAPRVDPMAARVAEVSDAARQPPAAQTVPTLSTITDAIRRADQPGGRPVPEAAPGMAGEPQPGATPQPVAPAPSGLTAEGQAAARYANEPPTPQPAGAQINTGAQPEPTRSQAQTNFENDVRQTAEERAGPQGVDHTAYLPGAERTEAAREFSPEASSHEIALRDTDNEFNKRVTAIETEGKKIADDAFQQLAGDKNAIDAAKVERAKYSPDELGAFDKEMPVDAGNIVGHFDALLNTRLGKRKGVRSTLEDARNAFLDDAGNPETLPSRLYGARQNLTDILDEGTGGSTSARKSSVQAARHFLTDALETIDAKITEGAPQFQTFLTKWHELSKPIDRMEFLQEHRFGPGSIYGPDGLPQYGKIQKLLEKMVKFQNAGGTNAVKSFEPEHLQALVAIRNELAAWHYRDRLAATAGSPTVKRATAVANLQSGPLGRAIQYGAEAAAHGAALATMPGYANLGLLAARPAIKRAIESRAAKKLQVVKDRMLETAPRNPLAPPGAY